MRQLFGTAAVLAVLGVHALGACSASSEPAATTPPVDASLEPVADANGDGPAADATADVPKTAASDYCSQTFGAAIASLETCCTADDKKSTDYQQPLEAGQALQQACNSSLEGGVQRARLLFDSVAAKACAEEVRTLLAGCPVERLPDSVLRKSPCRDVFVGRQSEGKACTASHECENGLACLSKSAEDEEGTCEKPRPVGGSCDSPQGSATVINLNWLGAHRTCVSGSHCDGSSGKCVAPASGECTLDKDCEYGEVCVGDACKPLGKVGDPCLTPWQCGPELFCDIVVGTSAGTCAEKKPAGQACAQGFQECKGSCPDPDPDAGVDGGATVCKKFCGSN